MEKGIVDEILSRRELFRTTLVSAVACMMPIQASAQAYPSRVVRIVVPFPPAGGPLDVIARLFADQLHEGGGAGGVVENRVGAGGFVGASSVMQAAPDGYTILCATGFVFGLGQILFERADFDPHSFQPIGVAVRYPAVLVARPGLPFSNIAEFIDYAKAHPGKLTYGSQGVGTIGHLSMEQIKREAGIDILHVPFRGSGPAVAELLSGTIDVLIDSLTNTKSNVEADKLKLVAVATPKRLQDYPDVSAIAEGISGFDATIWVGFAAPPHTPVEIVEKLNATLRQMFLRPNVNQRLAAIDLTSVVGTPEEMRQSSREIEQRWSSTVRALLKK